MQMKLALQTRKRAKLTFVFLTYLAAQVKTGFFSRFMFKPRFFINPGFCNPGSGYVLFPLRCILHLESAIALQCTLPVDLGVNTTSVDVQE